MMRAIISTALRRSRCEDGVISLATFVFIITLGFAVVISLWGIGYISGAYNTLYAANQSAAYAAVTATASSGDSTVTTNPQVAFACPGRSDMTTCRRGPAIEAAKAVIAQSLAGGAPNNFGLFYDPGSSADRRGQVHLVGPSGEFDGSDQIQLYEMPYSASQSAVVSVWWGDGCDPPAGQDYVSVAAGPGQPQQIVCWRLREFGQQFPPQYQSAVVVRSRARVPMLPFCTNQSWCPDQEMVVAAAASQDQPHARGGTYYSVR